MNLKSGNSANEKLVSGPSGSSAPPTADSLESTAGWIGELCQTVRQLFEQGTPPRDLLARLAAAGEVLAGPGSVVSILFVDQDGLLRNGSSPNLPADYLAAIDRLKPDPKVGTCAAAAATGFPVMTPDFLADEKWAELRHLPLSLGFAGAWSMPIKSDSGNVLGTFGTYFKERRLPSSAELHGVELLASTAALALAMVR